METFTSESFTATSKPAKKCFAVSEDWGIASLRV